MELPLFIIYLIVWFWLTLKRKKQEGFFSVFFIFGLGGFAYFVVIPFELYIRGVDYFFAHAWMRLGSYERNLVLFISIISLFGFYFGLTLSCYRLLPKKYFMETKECGLNKNRYRWPIRILICIIIVSGSILIIFYRDLIFAQSDYVVAYGITYESPLYSFVKMHFLIALGLTAGLIKHRGWRWKGKTISLAIVILIVLMGILTSDKGPLLLALLTCASFIEFNKISFIKFVTISSFGSVCVIIIVLFFNLYRTQIPIVEVFHKMPWTEISFVKLDPGGPMVTLCSVIEDNVPLRYGKTYIDGIGVIIPKAIWPDRPLSLSEEFAQDFITDYSEGKGLGYSPLAESLLNFHIPGAFIHFFIFGFFFGVFLEYLKKRIFVNLNSLLVPFIYIVGYQIIIMSFRSPLVGPLKLLILIIVPYCVVIILLRLCGKIASPTQRFDDIHGT